MKFYYDAIANKYVSLHNVNAKDVPSGYIEVTEKEFNDHHIEIEFDSYDYGYDEELVLGLE